MSTHPKSEEEDLAERILQALDYRAVLDLLFEAFEHFAGHYLTNHKHFGDIPEEIRHAIATRDVAELRKYNSDWLDERDEMAYQAERHNQPVSVMNEYETLSVLAQLLDHVCSEPTTPFQLAGFFELLEHFEIHPYTTIEELFQARIAR